MTGAEEQGGRRKETQTKTRYVMELPLVMRSRSSQRGVKSDPASAASVITRWRNVLEIPI